MSSFLIRCCLPTYEDGNSPDFMRLYTVLVCTLRYLAVSSTVSKTGRLLLDDSGMLNNIPNRI